MTGPVPGAPVNPIRGQKFRFMFLGGPLDHTIRHLPTTGALHVPPDEYVAVTKFREKINGRAVGPLAHATLTYRRHRATDGQERSWFVMVLADHNPTPSDLLDAYPYPPIV